jgi:hypothetical protein
VAAKPKNQHRKGNRTVDALFAAFLISSTAILSVGLGVLGAYYAITAILSAFDPARPSRFLAALAPQQSHASGD